MPDLGIDTGGTFTDLVLAGEGGLTIHKVPSTPRDPSEAFMKGVEELCPNISSDISPSISQICMTHGSTVATNALLERKGARIALVTTAGFEDVLAIGRQNRPSLYDFNPEKPPPLVARSDIFGVAERTFHDGKIEIELDKQEVERIAETIIAGKYDSVAICFLHSYANPENETRAADIIEKTGVPVSVSHRVLPQYREYERFGTTSINAYVSPVMATYLEALEEKIPKHARLRVMQSNGGSISSARARQEAVRTILSGPAAGVVGAFEVARRAGFDRIITFDMGGTSTDVSLCDGKISIRTSSTISGCPVGVPVVDIHTVGAGGGSISWLDEAGSLRVGPKSAGADPGPVCYGRGSEITVTDANLLLGRMSAEHFLGGAMPLDFDRAERHMLKFANDLGLSVGDAAEGVLKVANAVMERAVRVISVERGHDPRRFALVAFGGAGPMHACDLARSLSIPNIIIPNNAGVLSALGLVLADVSKDFSRTVLLQVEDVSPEKLDSLFAPLEKQAAATLASEGFTPERIRLDRQLDMRYVGQSYEVTVAAGPDFLNAFHAEHFRLYGHSSASRPAELVNIRLAAVGATDKPELARAEVSDDKVSGSGDAVLERKLSIFEGASFETPIHDRTALGPGDLICGPAIIVELSATTVVAPDFEARVDAFGNLIMKSTAG